MAGTADGAAPDGLGRDDMGTGGGRLAGTGGGELAKPLPFACGYGSGSASRACVSCLGMNGTVGGSLREAEDIKSETLRPMSLCPVASGCAAVGGLGDVCSFWGELGNRRAADDIKLPILRAASPTCPCAWS